MCDVWCGVCVCVVCCVLCVVCCVLSAEGIGVAEWARALTGDWTVNGSSPAAAKTFRFASELWQFRLPLLAGVFRIRH